jgi:hypothetical protein
VLILEDLGVYHSMTCSASTPRLGRSLVLPIPGARRFIVLRGNQWN